MEERKNVLTLKIYTHIYKKVHHCETIHHCEVVTKCKIKHQTKKSLIKVKKDVLKNNDIHSSQMKDTEIGFSAPIC